MLCIGRKTGFAGLASVCVGFADRAAAASELGCRRAVWAFVEVEFLRKSQGDVKAEPGAVQPKGCSDIYFCSSSLGCPPISHLKVTNDRIDECLWVCSYAGPSLVTSAVKGSRQVLCDVLCT